MASRKSILDDCTTVLLRSSAGLISDDRQYRAPTLDREPIAHVLSKAHQFEILSSAETTLEIHELTMDLHRRATEAVEAHSPTDEIPVDHPMLILKQAMILSMAVDAVISSLMVRRANKSKGFAAYLKPDQHAATKTMLNQLAECLTTSPLRDLVLRETSVGKDRLDAFVAALTLQETRLFAQRFVDHAALTIRDASQVLETHQKRPRGRPRKVLAAATDDLVETATTPAAPQTVVDQPIAPRPPLHQSPLSSAAPLRASIGSPTTVDEFLSGF